MKVENVKVYDLEESIIASGYPMMTNLDNTDYESKNMEYWLPQNLALINKLLKENDLIKLNNNIISMKIDNLETFISAEDLIKVSQKKWSYNAARGYIRCTDGETELHRFICGFPENMCVDHKDRNKLNNTRNNLRICTHRENSINKDKLKNNSSGFTGVYWNKGKNKWQAIIEVNKKRIHLGYFNEKKAALIARLKAEKDLFGEFAPQRHLFQQYNIDEIEENNVTKESGFTPSLEKALKNYNRIIKLAGTGGTSGHDQWLTGVRVAFDLTFSNKAWVELERYRFIEFVSSQSTMHRISKFNLKNQYNKYTDPRIIEIMEELKDTYNLTNDKEDYLKLLYSNPAGFELTARLTTNYRALKTVYSQRREHRLPEWRTLCKWIETLEFSELITGK